MVNNTTKRIALCGNPNCGKSSLFNYLTGLQQKITNIPGTTIERRTGFVTIGDQTIQLIDTPGTYSINPKSKDEEAALELFSNDHPEHPDLIVYVADAHNLKRNLFYFSQLADLNIPLVLVLNMLDVSKAAGIEIDAKRLEQELGIPVLLINARTGKGLEKLKTAVIGQPFNPHYQFVDHKASNAIESRYEHIVTLLKKVLHQKTKTQLVTEKIDPILTHPVWGYLIFLGTLLVIFQSVFWLADYPMRGIEYGFNILGKFLIDVMPANWFRSLLVNGIVAGLAGVVVFIPQIAILFFFMGVLEDTGYMARVSFIMDKILRGLGLSGKSIVPLISGVACAIPAIMATRNIENWKDRIITILVTPLMSCSARLPVYALLISVAIPDTYLFGIFGLKGMVLLAMYVLGTVGSLFAALVFKFIIRQTSINYFIMELPIYHPPRWKNIGTQVLQKSKSFVTEAGKIIIIVSVFLWFLASYGPNPQTESVFQPVTTNTLESSYAGRFGKQIEPVIKPLGFNWKIGIALLTSFAAREVFVGTMSTIYSVEDENDLVNIREKMSQERDPVTGKPVYSIAVILSLMVFYAFAMQCFSTLAVVYKETKSIKWPLIQLTYMTGLAYLASFIVFQLLR
ncbi:MAG: ferrous iron transport protein B [Bacteroidia bacterium]|jgi:ferrous iron transport protein B